MCNLIPMQIFYFRYNDNSSLRFKVTSYTYDGSDINFREYNKYSKLYDIYDCIRKRFKSEELDNGN